MIDPGGNNNKKSHTLEQSYLEFVSSSFVVNNETV